MATIQRHYEKFDLMLVAQRARNYLLSMVDRSHDCLPYWYVQINEAPAYARHVRVDDAELVASWYEAAVSVRKILGMDKDLKEVENGFRRHLMKSWGPKGLRYHEPYAWSNTNHSSFHEMAYILSALNRVLAENPGDKDAEKRSAGLVRGMRSLVTQRKIRTFWSGDYPINEPVYEFPGDVYLRDGGFVPERLTGRGEESIRNGMVLHSLVVRADCHGDEVALDLAQGIANHLLGLSRYFNWKGEFFGHVHSAVWVASGLARLGRLVKNEYYVRKSHEIFEYVRKESSEFGWVPEYGQWQSPEERFCETCCIKDMIECALELIDAGGFDYWDLVNRFTRNQLVENQIKDGCFISEDNSRPDADGYTWKNMSKRIVGGWSGGSEPNSISLAKFRSIAGCCVGTAPQALHMVWDRIVTRKNKNIFINMPIDRDAPDATVETGYPDEGLIRVKVKTAGDYHVRAFDWMGSHLAVLKNGLPGPAVYSGGCILFPSAKRGDKLEVRHNLDDAVRREKIRGQDFSVTWRGSDVVRLDPPGAPLRLYQREQGVAKEYPQPLSAPSGKPVKLAPTDQKK